MPTFIQGENKEKLLAFTLWQAMAYGIYLAIVYKIELPDANEQGKAFFKTLFTDEKTRDQLLNCLVEVEGQVDQLWKCEYPIIKGEILKSYSQQLALIPLIYLTISLVTALTIYGAYTASQKIKKHITPEDERSLIRPSLLAQRHSDHHHTAIHSPPHQPRIQAALEQDSRSAAQTP